MTRTRTSWLLSLLCLLGPGLLAEPREITPGVWEGVGRVVAIGDTHGTPDSLAALLVRSGLTDADLGWIAGADHLVLVGDLLDRGPRERELLQLVRRLEGEAREAGGRVHVLVGNHEVMNLIRDLRYVPPEGYAAFADEENARERKRLRKRWIAAQVDAGQDKAVATTVYDQRYPPGFLGRVHAFERGEVGKWLLSQPIAVKIDGVVFVHGGISPEFAELGIEGLNRAVRDELSRYFAHRDLLEQRGLLYPASYYREHHERALALLAAEDAELDDAVREAAEGIAAFADSDLFWGAGPLWFRGYAKENERYERDDLAAALELLGARAMVIGHTPTYNGTISQRFGGRLYRVDVGMAYGGEPRALVLEGDRATVLDPATDVESPPYVEPPQGQQPRPEAPPPDRVDAMLETGPVIADLDAGGPETHGARLVHIRQDNTSIYAAFWGTDDVAHHRRATQELAAHGLSGMLGLRLVPRTVSRELDGVSGALQRVHDRAVDGESVREYGVAPWDAEAIEAQRRQADAFDALIGNCRRPETEILYLHDERRLLLVNHSRAFAISLLAGCGDEAPLPEVPGDLVAPLEQLDRDGLDRALGGWLTDEQIAAILTRRDRVLGRGESDLSRSGPREWRRSRRDPQSASAGTVP